MKLKIIFAVMLLAAVVVAVPQTPYPIKGLVYGCEPMGGTEVILHNLNNKETVYTTVNNVGEYDADCNYIFAKEGCDDGDVIEVTVLDKTKSTTVQEFMEVLDFSFTEACSACPDPVICPDPVVCDICDTCETCKECGDCAVPASEDTNKILVFIIGLLTAVLGRKGIAIYYKSPTTGRPRKVTDKSLRGGLK